MSDMRKRIITELSMQANWYELLQQAEQITGSELDEPLEHYLILTLNNLQPSTHDFNSIVSIDYLEALSCSQTTKGYLQLRSVGDQCLLINGLFPEISLQRNVSLNYYAVIGQQAYALIGDSKQQNDIDHTLFKSLSIHFVGLTDLLNTMQKIKK